MKKSAGAPKMHPPDWGANMRPGLGLLLGSVASLAVGGATFAAQAPAKTEPEKPVDVCLTNACSPASTQGLQQAQPRRTAPIPANDPVQTALAQGYVTGKPWLETMAELGFNETGRQTNDDGTTTYDFNNGEGARMRMRLSPGMTPGAPPPPGATMVQRRVPAPGQ